MIKLSFFLFFVLSFGVMGTDHQLKVESILSPDNIIISDDCEKSIGKYKLTINYRYTGNKLIADTAVRGKFSCSRKYKADMMILYVTRENHFLPKAYEFFQRDDHVDILFGTEIIQGDIKFSRVFKNDDSNEIEVSLFDPFLKHRNEEKEEMLQALRSKSIREIIVIIKTIKILWELKYSTGNTDYKKQTMSGEFHLPINRVLRLPVDYK
jgi:hypothetical protein